MSKTALNILHGLNVNVKLDTKVRDPIQLPNGQYELNLSGGEKLVVDLYIPTYGVVPNSSYVPLQFKDANGYVKVDQYLGVEGAEAVFATGDVSSTEGPQLVFVDAQAAHVAKNLVLILQGKPRLPYKPSTTRTLQLSFPDSWAEYTRY